MLWRLSGHEMKYEHRQNQELVHVAPALLVVQIESIFRSWGVSQSQIKPTVEAMVEADTCGIDSHGISMLMLYEQIVNQGTLNLKAAPKVVKESPSTALIDGDAGFGHPVARMGMALAIEKSRNTGVGSVSVYNSHHFGIAGYYAKMASDVGLIGLVTSSTRGVFVTPTHARGPVLGTNPIAFAAPTGLSRPFLLDMSTSTVASNKIKDYGLKKKSLPNGWVVDTSGNPITDAVEARSALLSAEKKAGITPLGGTSELGSHKGYGLAMMVQILSATLSGSSFSPLRDKTPDNSSPDNIGHFFLAINPAYFRPAGDFEIDLQAMIDFLHATPTADPTQSVLVAGDPEFDEYERRKRDGVPIPRSLLRLISEISERAGAPYLL
jgi:LDH2 family malate/lactate/ureidoglycolate dehydrogenase